MSSLDVLSTSEDDITHSNGPERPTSKLQSGSASNSETGLALTFSPEARNYRIPTCLAPDIQGGGGGQSKAGIVPTTRND